MNLSKLMGNKKAAYAILERGALPSGTSCISDNANVEINVETAISNLEKLKKSYTGNDMRGFYTDLCKALGLPVKTKENKGKKKDKKKNANNNKSDVSRYGRFFIGGKYISIRVSNHRSKADTYIENGNYVYNLSIVVGKKPKNRLKANDNVLLEEYAYFGKLLEDIENPMIKIIDGIIEYLRTGEYKDLVGIDGAKQISPESEGLYNKLKEQYLKLLKNTDMKEVFTYSVHNLSTDGEGWLNSETQKEYYDLKTAISAAKKELAKYKNVEDEVVVTIFGGEYEDENGNIEGEPRIFQQFSNKDKKFDSIINNSKNFMTMDKIKDSFSATDISDEVAAYFDFLEELANEWEYGLDISNNREGEWALEFAKYTSAGQDFSAIILIDKDTNADYVNDEVLKELGDYTEYFDAHEQADLWSEVVDYDEDGNEIREGRNGAPADYNDIVADMEEARNDLYDFYLDLRRESEKFIENNATDWILNKLDKVKGVFYTISKSELNTSYEDEYEPFDTLGGAVTNAMEGLSEGKRWVVVDENGVVMFDCNDSTSRERFAMEGGYEEWANIILNFLTHEAENLIE